MANVVDINNFRVELDTYDALTVEAIMENRQILDKLYSERDAMLDNAYQLEDGMRVFKSVDGQRVYDEHGNIVSPDSVQVDMIDDRFPKAEPYLDKLDMIDTHEVINNRLTSYQEKLDTGRERLDNGDLSQKEFDTMRQALQADMPIEVRRKLPGYDPSQETNLKSDFAASTKTVSLSRLDMSINPEFVPG